MAYYIAYTDENGRGLDSNIPLLLGEYEEGELEYCRRRANVLIDTGMYDVTIFMLEDDCINVVTWSYVNEHKVT